MEENPQLLSEVLSDALFKRIKELKDKEEEYCIIDRTNSDNFIDVFKDAIYSYRKDCIICERFYLKSQCSETKVPVLAAPEEAKALYKEFIDYANSLKNIESLSEDEQTEAEAKLQEYKDRLSNEDMQPKVAEADALCYKNDFIEKGYLVAPLKDIPDENLKFMVRNISQFVIVYFLTMRILLTEDIKINLFPVKTDDYIDIVAMLETK